MLLKNARILTDEWKWVQGDLRMEEGKITAAPGAPLEETYDCGGQYLIPGLVETHFHGAMGENSHCPTERTLETFSKFEASRGITTFVAGPGSVSDETVEYFLELSKAFMKAPCFGAKMAGVYLEGPFISYERRGGHAPELLQKPSAQKLQRWQALSGGIIKKSTVAPELEGAEETVRAGVECGIVMEMGHTIASYEKALEAMDWGVTLATHTFNGMEPLNHRSPGVVGAVLTDDRVTCELIADFGHVAPAAVKLVCRAKGDDRVNIISDSMEAAGWGDGVYPQKDGTSLVVKDGISRKENGTITGSACTIMEGLRNLVSIGIPLESAVKMASYNPARTIGMADRIGSIAPGKSADLVLLDEELKVTAVFVDGKRFI